MENLSTKEREQIEELAQRVGQEDYELPAVATPRRATDQDRAAMRQLLEDAAETTEEKAEVHRSLGGRPTLDPNGSASVAWRVRVPADLDEQLRERAAAEGRSFSEVLRAAAAEYLAHRAAS